MKRILLIFLLVINALYADLTLTQEEKAWLASKDKITVGIQSKWVPLSYMEGSQPKGLGVDYINLINNQLQRKLVIVPDTFKNNLEKVKQGSLDAMIDITPTLEREAFYAFTTPYANIPHYIVTRKDSSYTFENVEDLAGKTIAVETGYGIIKSLKNMPGNYKLKYYNNTINALEGLSAGEADAYIGNRAVVNYIIQNNFLTNLKFQGKSSISRSVLAIGVNKDNKILRDILQKAYNNITIEDKNRIFKQYIGGLQTSDNIKFTAEEIAYLKNAPIIKVGGEKDWPPFDFVDENGDYQGISKDVMEQVASMTGLQLKYVIGQSWKELLQDFQAGKIDILPAIYKNADRQAYTEFTDSYFTVKDYAFVRKNDNSIQSIDDFKNKKIAIVDGYAIEKNLKDKFPNINLYKVKTQYEGINAVLLKKADVYIDGYAVVMHTLNTDFITGIKPVFPINFYTNKLYIGVNKDKQLLASIVNKALNAISEKEKKEIFQKWFLSAMIENEDNTVYTKQEQQWLDKHPSIRLAYMNYWPVDDNGNNIHSEYVNLLSQYGKINITLIKYDVWKDGFSEATKGDNVQGILNLSWSEEREKNNFNYTSPYFFTPVYLIVKDSNTDIFSINDLANKPIYTKKDSIVNKIVKQLGFNINPIVLNNEYEMFEALSKKDSDAQALLTYSYDDDLLRQYGLKVASQFFNKYGEVYIGTSKKVPELHSIINKAFMQIPKSELSKIQNKNYKKRIEKKVYLTQKEKNYLKKHPVLKVQNETSWPPFNFYEFGQPKGFSIDLIKMVAKNIGVDIKFVSGPTWNDFLNMIQKDEIDVLVNIAKNEKREKFLSFSDPYVYLKQAIVVHKDNQELKSFDDLKDKTIAIGRNFYTHDFLTKNYPEIKLLVVDDSLQAMQAVSDKRADATIGLVPEIEYISQKYFIDNIRHFPDQMFVKPRSLHFSTMKNNTELQSILQKGLASITPEQYKDLKNRWLNHDSEEGDIAIVLTDTEKQWLREHRKIKFTADPNYLPFEAFDAKSGYYFGMVADYIEIIEDVLNIEFEKIPSKSWSQSLDMTLNQKVDVLSNYTVDQLLEHTHISTKPYITSPISIVMQDEISVGKTLNDLKNKKIAVIKGYGYLDNIFTLYPHLNYVEVENAKEGLAGVSSGKYDAMLCSLTIARFVISDMGLHNLHVVGQTGHIMQLGLTIRKDWTILAHLINRVIDAIPQGRKQEIQYKWLGNQEDIDKKIYLSEKEQAWVNKNKPLYYVYDVNWAPFEWKNEIGEHTGIIYDILSLIEERSGLQLNYLDLNSWADAVDIMKNNQADMYSAIGENKERQEYLNFTKNAIFKTPYVFVTRSNDQNDYLETFKAIKNKKAVVVKDYAIHGILKEHKPLLPVLTVKNIEEGFEGVRNQTYDIFIVNAATAKYYINRLGYDDLKIATKTEFNLELKIGLQKELPEEVLSILDKAIATISEKEYSDIYFKWTEVLIEEKFNWDLFYKLIAGTVVLLLIVIYWNRKLKKIVDNKTKELKQLLESFDENVIASKTDLDGRIKYVSKAFCEISEYREDELIGNFQNIVRHPDMDGSIFRDLWQTIQNGHTWRGEVKNRKKSGGFYWVYLIVEPDFDEYRNIVGYSAILQDITSKKEVEELSESLELKVEERTAELIESQREIEKNKLFVDSLLDSQEQMVITTDGQKIINCNKAFLDFFEIEKLEDFTNEYNCICERFVIDDTHTYLQKQMGSLSWLDYILEHEDDIHKAVILKDGEEQFFTVTAATLQFEDANIKSAVFTDITEMENSRKNIETILSNIMLPVLITSKKDRTILYANEYASIQYETSVDELIGSSIDSVYTNMDQKNEILNVMHEYGYVENLEERYKTRTGKEFIGLLSVKPIFYNNEKAFIGMVVDITKQKEIEEEIRHIHKHTQSSIEYASLIQHSLVPSNDLFRKYFDDYFAIWHPKDIVGGDIYLFEELRNENECLLMVIDCTGHGVPGAFVTMLVKALERQVVARIVNNKDIEVSPAEILQYFNKTMKKLLKQEDDDSISNAGFDGAIVYYNQEEEIIRFAGAELPLFYVEDDEFKTIKGNRQSIGYKKSDSNFVFKEHEIQVKEGMQFYITSDGYLDQNGGEKGFPLGKKRFLNILDTYKKYSFADQQEVLLNELHLYQGNEERNDDITIVGFKIGNKQRVGET